MTDVPLAVMPDPYMTVETEVEDRGLGEMVSQ